MVAADVGKSPAHDRQKLRIYLFVGFPDFLWCNPETVLVKTHSVKALRVGEQGFIPLLLYVF